MARKLQYERGKRWPGRKIIWTDEMINQLIDNFPLTDNRGLAKLLGLGITATRTKLYELGMLRMEMEYWTEEQVRFLKDNYRQMGDLEMAGIFEEKWPKKKRWTIKHLEKKRKYLGMKRTEKEIEGIYQRQFEQGKRIAPGGRYRYITRGPATAGEIRFRMRDNKRLEPMVRVEKRFVHWAPWAWRQKFGPPKKGHVIVFKDDDPTHVVLENLEEVSRSELTRRNATKSSIGLSDTYLAHTMSYRDPEMRKELVNHPALLDVKRKQLLLKRTINECTVDTKKA